MKRYLAHYVLHRGAIHRLSLLTIDDDNKISIHPFDGETHSTPFINGLLAIVDNRASLPDDLLSMTPADANAAISDANGFLTSDHFTTHAKLLHL